MSNGSSSSSAPATPGEGDVPISTPRIQNVMVYDYALRTKFATMMNNGVDAETALMTLISPIDPQSVSLKQINFINNVAIGVDTPEARRKRCRRPFEGGQDSREEKACS